MYTGSHIGRANNNKKIKNDFDILPIPQINYHISMLK